MASLCETCDREVFFKCQWVMKGREVPGWEAKFVKTKKGQLDTFMVISCPNYLKEKREKISSLSKTVDEAMEKRCIVCGKRLGEYRKKFCSNKCYKAAASKAAADKKKIKTAEDLKKLIEES